jgi:molecular chaperone Hsp33
MSSTDRIVRGLVAGSQARFVAVVATRLARDAARRHEAEGSAAIALGRAGAAGLLLATLTKGDERVTLQILGDGPLGAVTVDATSGGEARIFLRNPAAGARVTEDAAGRPSIGPGIGRSGIVSVVRDLGMRDTFRGQTELADGEIDTDVEKYLAMSEQIDSALACETLLDAETGEIRCAVGVLLQALPGGEGAAVLEAARARLRAGELAAALGRTLGALDADAPPPPTSLMDQVAQAALGERVDALDILDARPVRFHCPCTRDRARTTLGLLGQDDLAAMIREDGAAEVTCDFCRTTYTFTDADLEEIRRELRPEAVAPS